MLHWKCSTLNLLPDGKADRSHKCAPVYRSSCSFEKALPDPAAECRAASLCGLGLCPAKAGIGQILRQGRSDSQVVGNRIHLQHFISKMAQRSATPAPKKLTGKDLRISARSSLGFFRGPF